MRNGTIQEVRAALGEMRADKGALIFDVEDFMFQVIRNLHETRNHELIIDIDKVLHEDGEPAGREADVVILP
ncbi:MAG: hypothetical protein R2912_12310 [Eubacteriales bacterium]